MRAGAAAGLAARGTGHSQSAGVGRLRIQPPPCWPLPPSLLPALAPRPRCDPCSAPSPGLLRFFLARFDVTGWPTTFAGQIRDFDNEGLIDKKNARRYDDCLSYTVVASKKVGRGPPAATWVWL